MATLVNAESGDLLLADLEIANAFWKRFKGLQWRKSLSNDSGLWLSPCSSLHTCFMHFPIDIFMLDRDGKVVGKRTSVPPWRLVFCARGTRDVLETNAGSLDLELGMSLRIEA